MPHSFLNLVKAGCQGLGCGRETVMLIPHATIERGREDVVLVHNEQDLLP